MKSVAQFDLVNPSRSLTTLLDDVNGGGSGAFGRLIDAVYDDMRRVAANRMKRKFDAPLAALTEGPTALAHEAILRLREQRAQWKDGDHFFAIATRLLGYVIGDYQRRRDRMKRGGGRRGRGNSALMASLAPAVAELDAPDNPLETLAVIQTLHEHYPREAEVVSLRILAGKSMPEIAEKVGVSLATAERDWKFARAWLRDRLEPKREVK